MTTAAPPPGNATGPSVGALEPDINTIGTGSDDGRESTSSQARTPADRAGQRVPETGDSQVAQWVRVSRSNPCPICGRPKYCSIDATDGTVLCMKIESDRPVKSGGWLHRPDGSRPLPRLEPPRPKMTRDWRAIAKNYAEAIDEANVARLAEMLGVDPIALRELGVGWNGNDWTFPMRGADGEVCGVRRRTRDGSKLAMKDSSLGIIRRETPDDGLLLVCEGESDTAAALTMGLDAIGTPGAGQCGAAVAAWARGRDVVIVCDADKPGREGAAKIAKAIAGTAKSVLTIEPPEGTKDLRAWLRAGAIRADVEAAIEAAAAAIAPTDGTGCLAGPEPEEEPPPPSPIVTLWRPIRQGVMRTEPPPRRYLLRHPTRDGNPCPPGEGDGLMPRGKAGLFIAEGGAGKSLAVMAMAVCLVTGRPWLGHYHVDPNERGSVLLLLGEEDQDEIDRRLWAIGAALQLTDAEQAEVERRVIAIPLAGESAPFLEFGMRRDMMVTHHFAELRQRLHDEAPADGWSMVVIDPLARFAGLPIDLDNMAATRVVQAIESLVRVPGNPMVLSLHHTNAQSRRNGEAHSRGATAITDGVRWVASLTNRDSGNVEFKQTKSNYSRPMPVAMELARGPRGVLVAIGAVDQRDARAEQDIEDRAAILASLAAVGTATKIDSIVHGAKIKAQRGRAIVARLVDEGLIEKVGRRPDVIYRCVCTDPLYPRDVGTSSVAGAPERRPKRQGRRGTPGTTKARQTATAGTLDEGQPEKPKGGKRKPRLVKP